MPTMLYSCSLQGLDCELIEVEIHLSQGLPAFHIVGLGDTAIHESKERVRSAILNSGFRFPTQRKTINLAPAHIKKKGPLFDLPIALGVLIESKQIQISDINKSLFVGELALDGRIKKSTGILVITDFAKHKGFKRIYIPSKNQFESQIINGIDIIGIGNLNNFHHQEVYLNPQKNIQFKAMRKNVRSDYPYDFALIKGQKLAKRALEIAAAGRHHILFSGPPGCGKTLLARSFPSILPPLNFKEQLEVSRIYSITGQLTKEEPLISKRPFREVHHTASAISIIGGGGSPRPGEISLAHKGVLFLDEIAEFPRAVLDVLRQPIESHYINITRASGSYRFPAEFQLIAAMNPCLCGYKTHPKKECKCSAAEAEAYTRKISGPLKDRIDINIQIQPVSIKENAGKVESSLEIQRRVEEAYNRQKKRYEKEFFDTNSSLSLRKIKKYINLSREAQNIINLAIEKLNLSMRAYNRILKLSLTISDIEKTNQIKEAHISEAISYRIVDKN